MSEDETLVLMFSLAIAAACWVRWYWTTFALHRLVCEPRLRRMLLIAPLLSALLLTAGLKLYASFDVRDSVTYMFFYIVFGMAWIGVFTLLPLWGVSPRDDALERRNPAATVMVVGLMFGLTLAFVGGNIGDGPGWWVVVFASGLATANVVIFWWLLNAISPVAEHVTVDRDVASGWRAAAYLVGCGLVSGRAAAGDWISADATFVDFVSIAWSCLVLLVIAVVLERLTQPTPSQPHPPTIAHGVLPAMGLLTSATIDVVLHGWWA